MCIFFDVSTLERMVSTAGVEPASPGAAGALTELRRDNGLRSLRQRRNPETRKKREKEKGPKSRASSLCVSCGHADARIREHQAKLPSNCEVDITSPSLLFQAARGRSDHDVRPRAVLFAATVGNSSQWAITRSVIDVALKQEGLFGTLRQGPPGGVDECSVFLVDRS